MQPIAHILLVGGGTAGWLTAASAPREEPAPAAAGRA